MTDTLIHGLYREGEKIADTKAPHDVPISERWARRQFEAALVNPANRRKLRVIIVGSGLAGGAAAASLGEMGYHVDLVPEGAAGVPALLDIWPTGDGTGTVLVPGSALLAPGFISGLHAKGWKAQLIPVYTMQLLREAPADIREMWEEGAFDAVIVTSGSNAIAVGRLLGWHPDVLVFAIGDSATKVLERAGIKVAAATENYSSAEVLRLLREVIEG